LGDKEVAVGRQEKINMEISIEESEIKGLFVISGETFTDERGFFREIFQLERNWLKRQGLTLNRCNGIIRYPKVG